ncbi:MAG: DUF4012 domain-containing protein [Chloroflexi bacterium]|nr:DUF4012 domain-containing protein [Chloroflexota bacterium]
MPRFKIAAPHSTRARWLRALGILAGFCVLWMIQSIPPRWGALAVLTYLDVQALRAAFDADETRAAISARALVRDARAWRVEFSPLSQIAPALAWLPYLGGDFAKYPQLAVLLDESLNAVQPSLALYEKLTPYLKTKAAGAALVAFAQENATAIADARRAVQNARAKYAAINTRDFSPHAHWMMRHANDVLTQWDAALRLLERAPVLLGAAVPKRYLVLAQNNDELRPTGGFISAIGVIEIEAGEIIVKSFGDSFAADDLNLIHPPPPAPLQKYMWASQWLLRDANWYAHFPTSADVAQSMYARDRGIRADGVIAIDLRFMPLLVGAISDLQLDGAALTSGNVLGLLKESWKPLPTSDNMTGEWFTNNRKNFLGELMNSITARIKTGKVSSAALAQALARGLRNKSVQLYFNDSDAQQAVLDAGWGGAVAPGAGDYLNVVDSNLGFNKVNARVTREIFYTVRLHENGGDATVEIRYHNPSRAEKDACDLLRQHKDATYASMEQSCYWNYVRVLAPRFTQFVSAQGVVDAGYADDIDAVTALGGYFIVDRNSDARITFHYALPNTILRDKAYTLTVQSQAGAAATPLRVRVEYPAAWTIHATTVTFSRIDDNTLEFQSTLDRDKILMIYFE